MAKAKNPPFEMTVQRELLPEELEAQKAAAERDEAFRRLDAKRRSEKATEERLELAAIFDPKNI